MVFSRCLLQWLYAAASVTLPISVLSANIDAWKTRTVYQTMTDRFTQADGSTTRACNLTEGIYCGGTWRGTINRLDYIQDMGFDAVMISPIVKNIEERVSYGEAYHGYWVQDMYTLNSHFGTHQDLLDLSQAVHDRDMFLMMDTVINNMAYPTNGGNPATDVNYSSLSPFNDLGFYNPYCKIYDWNDYPQSQYCWTGDDIVALPDLNTEDDRVQTILEMWIQQMISTYSIDGLRLDAAKHITPGFLPRFQEAANTFMFGEVYERSVDILCNYQKDLKSVTNYPIYFALLDAFTLGNIESLPNQVETMKNRCPSVTDLTIFSENHDIPRFAGLNDDINVSHHTLQSPNSYVRHTTESNQTKPNHYIARQKHPNIHPPLRWRPDNLPRPRTTLLRLQRPLQPRSPLALRLQHLVPALQNHNHTE